MKKTLVMAVIAATGFAAHAANLQWYGVQHGGNGIHWNSASNWVEHGGTVPILPASNDLCIVDARLVWDGSDDGNDVIVRGPCLNTDAGSIAILWMNWRATNALCNIVNAGSLRVTDFARVGYAIDSEGILNIDDGYMVTPILQIGYNSTNENAGGSGVINLSGNAVLHCGALGFAQASPEYAAGTDQDGTGVIHLSGSARFLVNGDHTLAGTSNAVNWITNGWIDAYNSTVEAVYATNGWTEFTSASKEEISNLFIDDFNSPDDSNANTDVLSRQGGRIAGYYHGFPQYCSITNIAADGKMNDYWTGAFLYPGLDFSTYLIGEDFELSFKLAVQITGGDWASIYLCDEDGEDRAGSRLGMHVPGSTEPWDAIVYYGTGGAQTTMPIDFEWFPALAPYDKTQEHTFRFVSTAGAGGTNSFDLYVDGVEITDGVTDNGSWIMPDSFEYYFDNTSRFIGIVGVMPVAESEKALYDDLSLNVIAGITYEDWVEDWGLTGSDTNRTADIEPDGMDNLLEYALGGNPLVDDAATMLPTIEGPVDVGGTNYLDYVYRRRNDAGTRGLTYDVQFKTDLVSGSWVTTGGLGEAGVNPVDSAINEVTVTIPTIMDYSAIPGFEAWIWDETLFLNLEVTEN